MNCNCTKIIEKYKTKVSKIDFNIKKISLSEILNIYKIDRRETVIAYLKGPLPFSNINSDGTILTSEALYIHPCRTEKKEGNRYPYDNFWSFFIIFKGGSSSLEFIGNSFSKTIVGITLFRNNIRGKELYDILLDIQGTYYDMDASFRIQHDNFKDSYIKRCNEKIKIGNLNDSEITALSSLIKTPEFKEIVVRILLKNALRICDKELFDEIVSGNSKIPKVETLIKTTYEELIENLENLNHDFEKRFLNKIKDNLEKKKNRQLVGQYCLKIQSYTFLRLEDYENTNLIYEEIINGNNNACVEFQTFILAKNALFNKRMYSVFSNLKREIIPDQKVLDMEDSLKYTVLHYAIFMKKSSVISKILEKIKIKNLNKCNTGELIFDALHKPDILAAYVGLENIDDIFLKTSPTAIALVKSVKALEKHFSSQQKMLALNAEVISSFQREIKNQERLKNHSNIAMINEKLLTVLEKRKRILDRLIEIDVQLKDIKQELSILIRNNQIERNNMLCTLRNNNNPLVENILCMINTLSCYEKFLSTPIDMLKIIMLNKAILCVPQTWDVIIESVKKDVDDITYPQKPYGDSWFSEDAHKNIFSLKKEYHLLAKKYHPDHCKHMKAKEIFQDILAERAEILESNNL